VVLPLEIMPPKVLPFIWALPLTHLSESLRGLMSMQRGLTDLWTSELVLLAYLAGLFALSVMIFKWDKTTYSGN
jgi:ABC-type multidrug transport system permease subunit